MSIETIFITQISSIILFIFALFGLYRLLVSQKDGVIELLREQVNQQKIKIDELSSQSPDVLVKTLSARIEISFKEIERLNADGGAHKEEIKRKENELQKAMEQMFSLAELITDAAFVCSECNAPLVTRSYNGFYGPHGEGEAEISNYECGLTLADDIEISPCKGKNALPKA